MNTYRRRQLEAMETDRKTLAALQDALKEMGLNNELGFISEKDSKMVSSEAASKDNVAPSAVP